MSIKRHKNETSNDMKAVDRWCNNEKGDVRGVKVFKKHI